MPSIKQFEAMKLSAPFEVIQLNMHEMLEQHTDQIKQLWEIIEDDTKGDYKTSVEVSSIEEESTLYHIWKEDNTFILEDRQYMKQTQLKPIEFYNWCFATAPFFAFIGKGR